MAYKILTKNGIDNSNIDGARGEYFNSGMRDGIVQGALNEGLFTATASNIISLDTCELRIAGHRIVIDEPVYHTFTNAPSSDTRYAFVAQIVVDDNQNVDFSLFVQTASTQLIQNDLYKNITGAGTYQVEIGRFTLLTTLTIEDAVRTTDVITGGTGKGNGGKINIGNVTTQTLDPDVDAEVDISERYEEDEGKEYLDFTFGIPKGETGPYFTPTVDDEGNLSWTNNGGLSNPDTVNIKGPQGPQGPAGDAGSFDADFSETSTNGLQNNAITNAIIRRDVVQTLTDTEKQQAQINITHTATQEDVNSGVQVGWYQVANLKTQGNYDIKIKQSYNYNYPDAIHLSISINNRLYTGAPFASITQLSGVKPAAYGLSKIRVRQGTDSATTFLDVYNPDQLWNTTWVDITSDSQDVVIETNSPFQFIGTEDNPSGYKVSSLDLVTGFNTNSSLNVENTLTVNNIADTNGNYSITPSQIANRSGKYSTLKSGGNVVVDTRDVNSPPSYYADQQTCYEFKARDTLGLAEYMPNSSYVTLTTKKGWKGDDYIVYQEAVSACASAGAIDDSIVCYRYGRLNTWGEWKPVGTFLPTVVIYDMDSEDENVNRGFTSGMKGTNYIQLDFSQYKSIRIYARLYTSDCVKEIPVKNRKAAQTAMVVTGSNPIIISSLNILFTIEPLLNRLQVGAYGKYTFSSAEGTFTLESGASNDNFYVYRIEGIR